MKKFIYDSTQKLMVPFNETKNDQKIETLSNNTEKIRSLSSEGDKDNIENTNNISEEENNFSEGELSNNKIEEEVKDLAKPPGILAKKEVKRLKKKKEHKLKVDSVKKDCFLDWISIKNGNN